MRICIHEHEHEHEHEHGGLLIHCNADVITIYKRRPTREHRIRNPIDSPVMHTLMQNSIRRYLNYMNQMAGLNPKKAMKLYKKGACV
jgi:hypothetical protein